MARVVLGSSQVPACLYAVRIPREARKGKATPNGGIGVAICILRKKRWSRTLVGVGLGYIAVSNSCSMCFRPYAILHTIVWPTYSGCHDRYQTVENDEGPRGCLMIDCWSRWCSFSRDLLDITVLVFRWENAIVCSKLSSDYGWAISHDKSHAMLLVTKSGE